MDPKKFNVWLHSICFCFVFAAFQTATMTSQSVMKAFEADKKKELNDPNYTIIDGYTSQMVLYIVFAISSWFVPVIISKTGSRVGMIMGGITYCIYVSMFIYPNSTYMWTASILLGMGAGILWTSQGRFITKCGTDKTKKQNGGIFWAFLQGGALLGNLIVYFAFENGISQESRVWVFTAFSVLTGVGVLTFAALKPVKEGDETAEEIEELKETTQEKKTDSPMAVLKNSINLLSDQKILTVVVIFIYTGISQVFVFGVHSSCVRASEFGGSKESAQLMAIGGFAISIGAMMGGVMDTKLPKVSTQIKFKLALSLQILAFFLCHGNFGDDAPKGKNIKEDDMLNLSGAYWSEKSNFIIALLTSFLVAFGDGLMNTQVIYYLSHTFTGKNSSAAFAIFKSVQSFSVAAVNSYASKMPLSYQIGILIVFSLASILLYHWTGFDPEPQEPAKEEEALAKN